MNKVININLGGYPFTIDEDAYEQLDKYLKTIHRHFGQSEGYEEITSDIELRMAELFQEQLASRQIVGVKEVEKAISIMGTPEEFGASPLMEEEESTNEKTTTEPTSNYKTGKRLFRDEDDKVISGVCSGLAAYFGIADPLWVRLGFVALTLLGFGFPVPAYIILIIVVPKAESAGDRLAMRGEPINASNIGKIIEEEITNLTEKVSDFGESIEKNFGSKKKMSKEKATSVTPYRKGFLF